MPLWPWIIWFALVFVLPERMLSALLILVALYTLLHVWLSQEDV